MAQEICINKFRLIAIGSLYQLSQDPDLQGAAKSPTRPHLNPEP